MKKATWLGLAIATIAGTGVCLGNTTAKELAVQRFNSGWTQWWDGDSWENSERFIPLNVVQTIDVETVGSSDVFVRVLEFEVTRDSVDPSIVITATRTAGAVVQGLTFNGTSAPGIGLLHIMVGETVAPEPSTFPSRIDVTTAFERGTGTIKSLTVADNLLTRSRLAAKLTNGVGDRVGTFLDPLGNPVPVGQGNIQVGQVYILDAVNDIYGTVHAHRADVSGSGGLLSQHSIERIIAGRWIDATIQAGGDTIIAPCLPPENPDPMALGGGTGSTCDAAPSWSINQIRLVGGTAQGVEGTIKALNGSLWSLYANRPLGGFANGQPVANDRLKVDVGEAIGEVRTYSEDELLSSIQNGTVIASRQANLALTSGLVALQYGGQRRNDRATEYGAGRLGRLEVTGDLHGQIDVYNLAVPGQSVVATLAEETGESDRPTLNPGIYIHGIARAPIVVREGVKYSSIVAHSFNEPINIGVNLKGAVVATGTNADGTARIEPNVTASGATAGRISSLHVGYGVAGTPSPSFTAAIERGFQGISADPMPLVLAADASQLQWVDWFNMPPGFGDSGGSFRPYPEIAQGVPVPLVSTGTRGAVDAVIRAASLGTLKLYRMHNFNKQGGRPRIEAPSIDDLSIGTIDSGAIWSGHLEYSQGIPANIVANDYADVARLSIGTGLVANAQPPAVSKCSDLFVRLPKLPEFARIDGDLVGSLHLPETNPDTLLLMHGGLSAVSVGCSAATTIEQSPRGNTYRNGRTSGTIQVRGSVRIDGEHRGQIVLHADQAQDSVSSTSFWGAVDTGEVLVMRGTDPLNDPDPLTTLTYDPNFTNTPTLFDAPRYDAVSSLMSADADGGAIGLAAYGQHGTDSRPVQLKWSTTVPPEFDTDVPAVTRGAWVLRDKPISLRFYGPISILPAGGLRYYTGQGIKVERYNGANPVTNDPADWQDVTQYFAARVARVQHATGSQVALTADNTLSRDLEIRPVCGMGLPELGLYRVLPYSDCTNARIVSDFTGDLSTTSDDVRVLPFAHYFRFVNGPCGNADVAGAGQTIGADGFLTSDDIIVFIGWFFAGDLRADVAGSGQIIGSDGILTADDIIVFVNWFFQGCGKDAATIDLNCETLAEESPCGSMMMMSPAAAPSTTASLMESTTSASNSTVSTPAGLSAQRLAQLDVLIAAEADPARRAVLQAARAVMLQGGGTSTPAGVTNDR
jgi:hypothetical protein